MNNRTIRKSILLLITTLLMVALLPAGVYHAKSSGKVTMYLLKTFDYYQYPGKYSWDFEQHHTYAYNKKGLLISVSEEDYSHGIRVLANKTLRYTKKSAVKEISRTCTMSGVTGRSSYKMTYRKGKLATCTEAYDGRTYNTWNYVWKKNRIVRENGVVFRYKGKSTRACARGDAAYQYDRKGNLKEITGGNSGVYENTYSGGLLTKRVFSPGTSGRGPYHPETYYSYIKVKVPKKMKAKVKAQQWALRNENLNRVFGPIGSL